LIFFYCEYSISFSCIYHHGGDVEDHGGDVEDHGGDVEDHGGDVKVLVLLKIIMVVLQINLVLGKNFIYFSTFLSALGGVLQIYLG